MTRGPAPQQEHLDLLGALLRSDSDAALACVGSPAFDPHAFVAMSRWHQIAGFVHWSLLDSPVRHAFPEDARQELALRHASLVRKVDLLDDARRSIEAAFARRGLDAILLKGSHLATEYYRNRHSRTYWDLDLLVRPEDRSRAQRILLEEGFERTSTVPVPDWWAERVVHAFDFARDEVAIDLHWTLSAHPSVRIDYDRLWRSRERRGRSPIAVLPAEYVLVQLLVSAFADLERGALRVRSLIDLWMVLARHDARLDWGRFFEVRYDEGIDTICDAMLRLFLTTFRARDRLPRLALSLAAREAAAPGDEVGGTDLLRPGALAVRRRAWCVRRYRVSSWRHWLWWATTLPVRFAVFKPGKLQRLRGRLRSISRKTDERTPTGR